MRIKLSMLIIALTVIAIAISSFMVGKQIFSGRQPDIISFSTIHFAGYLFFLVMPVELLFVYYTIGGFNLPILFTAALATAIVAEIIDYLIGYLVSNQIIKKIITEKRYKKTEGYVNKYGSAAVFLFNLLPLSSPILSLVAGMLRYRFRKLVAYSFIGLFLKYIIIIFLFSNGFLN